MKVEPHEMYVAVIAIGHGTNQGRQHKSKPIDTFADMNGKPDWFRQGVECAMLAPSAMNMQNFHFALLSDGSVKATTKPKPFSGIDLGIAKLHFELGAGKDNFRWAE